MTPSLFKGTPDDLSSSKLPIPLCPRHCPWLRLWLSSNPACGRRHLALDEILREPLNAPLQSPEDLFRYTRGPRDADIILIGEAWGSEENSAKIPFVGPSGKELDRILGDAGLSNTRILFTNVIHSQPPGNDFTHFLEDPKAKGTLTYEGLKVKPVLRESVENLHRLIARVNPKLIICAGNLPLWALSNHSTIRANYPSGIGSWRGSQTYTREILGKRWPLLPIIHPAAILREWGFRQITVQDLRRVARFLQSDDDKSWSPAARTFCLHRPTYQQVIQRFRNWKLALEIGPLELAVDLETYKRKWISVVGLADSTCELCIPLIFKGQDSFIQSYFALREEQEIWLSLKEILEHPNVRIIGQNFIYDTEWFHRLYNIRAIVSFDTMVAHHLLYPGTPKRLDYLASLYCEHYSYWKDESGDWDQFPNDADRYWKYNTKDTRATYECAKVLKSALKSQNMQELYDFQLENWNLSRSLMLRGIAFDSSLQKDMRLTLMEESSQISHWLLSVLPERFRYAPSGKEWFTSPKQTAFLLYEVLGLKPVLHKTTKKPTTDDSALQELGERAGWLSPLIERLRHLRSLNLFTANFLDARPGVDGRMRCSFNIAHPETFRWSSNSNGFGEGTNLQNIPKGEI